MKNICDYMIIQRDETGFGHATYSVDYETKENEIIVARVVNEENGIVVVPWQQLEKKGDSFRTELTIPQGGLYRVEARLASGKFNKYVNKYDWANYIDIAQHVGVGDIFVMAGQSNMSGYGKDPAFDPPELGVSLFNNSGNWVLASHPLCSVAKPIYPSCDGSSGTSPALSFAKKLHKVLNVPIGLISASVGGTSLENWNPAEEDPHLFNSMMDRIEATGKIRGMIWAQGCNETNEEECDTYFEKFTQAVGLWREKLGDIPIVTCQINRHASLGDGSDVYWGKIREAQRKAALTIPNVYVVPTMDMVTSDGIHNSSASNVAVGERLANVMLKNHYGLPGLTAPTVLLIEQIAENKILLHIDEGHDLRTMDDNACGMNIEDENGIMDCTSVSAIENGFIVTAERAIKGKAYFSAYWRRQEPAFFVRDLYGMPMLACYHVEIG